MGGRRGGAGSTELTERQRYWLAHIRTAEARGEPLKHYAKRRRLSEHAIYEAKRRLRELGALAPSVARKPAPPRFARVVVAPSPEAGEPASPLRVRLASGAVLEWSEAPAGEALRELLGMLAG